MSGGGAIGQEPIALADASSFEQNVVTTPKRIVTKRYRFDSFEACPTERVLRRGAEIIPLGARCAELLFALLEGHERLLSKHELLERVWPGLEVEEGNLATQISALRRVIGADAIITVPKLGYRFALRVDTETRATSTRVEAPSVLGVQAGVLRFGALEWRPSQRLALLEGKSLELGSRALDLLGVLIDERQRIVAKRELLKRVWHGLVVEENNLQVQVSALRKALGQSAIATIPGRGYRFTLAQSTDSPIAPHPVTVALPQRRQRSTNVPLMAEALIGRSEELGALDRLLTKCRLVTIVGGGGVGKTVLAQTFARSMVGRFANGVWWVDLGALSSAEQIVPAIASASGLQLGRGVPVEQLALALESRDVMIVLDNCEHLAPPLADIVSRILSVADRLRLLATTQEPLRLQQEHSFRLDPLSLPPIGCSHQDATSCSAFTLLEHRALAVDSRFVITEATLPAAIEICRQLDGIPLAIEMAAARLPQVGTSVLRQGLAERLQWLRNSTRRAPSRQRTLRATLDWSHSLLDEQERTVLRRLSVFRGTFQLESAQRVASDSVLDRWDVTEALATLVERSLIQLVEGNPPRYRLLESTRLYASEQLAAHTETDVAQDSHMRLMASIAVAAEQDYWVCDDESWLARYADDYDDLHAAFDRACTLTDISAAAQTLDALYRLDELREVWAALVPRLAAASRLLPKGQADVEASLRIRLAIASQLVAAAPIEGVSKLHAAQTAVVQAQYLADTRRLYRAIAHVALHATAAGDESIAADAMAQLTQLENLDWPARLLWVGAIHRSMHFALRGEAQCLLASLRLELALAQRAGSPMQAANARAGLADAALMCGDASEAIRLGREVVAEARAVGRTLILVTCVANLFGALIAGGALQDASEIAAETIQLAWRYERIGYAVDNLASLAARMGRFEDACTLIGVADEWWTRVQYGREGNEAAAVRHAIALSERALGKARVAQLRAQGSELDGNAAKRLVDQIVGPAPAAQIRRVQ